MYVGARIGPDTHTDLQSTDYNIYCTVIISRYDDVFTVSHDVTILILFSDCLYRLAL